MTKMIQIKNTTEDRYCNEIAELYSSNLDGCEVAIYDYRCGSYEGCGNALILKDGEWFLESLSHCSCYGPLNDFHPQSGKGYKTPSDIKASSEYEDEIKPLIEAAEQYLVEAAK